jgi:tetratricopeptide (TPR) repeat protein
MEVAAAIIIASGNAMARNAFTGNNLLVFRLPSFSLRGHRFTRPPLKALPSRLDADDEMSTRMIKPPRKLEWSSADSHSSNTTANPTDHSNKYPPLPPRHHLHINDDVQGRMKAYRAKCERQVLEEGASMNERAFYREFAEYASSVWLQNDLARKYYEKALTQMEMDASCTGNTGGLMAEYAEFLWKALGNGEEANGVFEKAVKDYPQDVQLLGSYAFFVWELSDNN